MPTTSAQIGTAGEANQKIGGVPVISYLDFKSRGRGQVLRIFFEEAGIAYKDVRYSFEEFPAWQESKLPNLNPLGFVPIVELDGKILTQSYPILRHFSRLLGKYNGSTEEETYWVDLMCDIAIDWRTLFVVSFFTPDKDTLYPKHVKEQRPTYLKGIEEQLSTNELSSKGPFVLGETITYADLVIYQICHDENLVQDAKELKEYPRIRKLVDGVEGRPNVKRFLESERYQG